MVNSIGPSRRIRVIDSHTGGEPTRVVVSGGPDLGSGTMGERLQRFRDSFDRFRSAIVNEPRGSDALVGALLCTPVDERSAAGVIFFNNVGYLGMCGHGTIGLVVTLAQLGRVGPGVHRIETPAGSVEAELFADGSVSITNVPSYRTMKNVVLEVDGVGRVAGDVAWGGNWFFLVSDHGQDLDIVRVGELTEYARRIRRALHEAGITGTDGAEIDHVELFSPSPTHGVQSRNFVLCPGHAYDRSPCGTGTSAKLACLVEDGRLGEGVVWRQESIVGSIFDASVRVIDGKIIPTIRGRASIIAEADLLLDEQDPFCWGIRT